jgi:hypothetical protein
MDTTLDINDNTISKELVVLEFKSELEILDLGVDKINSKRVKFLKKINIMLMSNQPTAIKNFSPVISNGFGFSFIEINRFNELVLGVD